MEVFKGFVKVCAVCACVFAGFETSQAAGRDSLKKSVVKIFSLYKKPNYYQPWQMREQRSSTGSGCIIAGKRIITNAHVVSDQVYLQVRKAGEPKKYTARVEYVAHDCDLALMKISDPAEESSFFAKTTPIKFGGLSRLRDKVAVYGFPTGGDELSITEGVVSRIEVTNFSHSGRHLLTIQIDAAINPGNSGGPVIQDGKIAGVSFQTMGRAENIGYIIPAPIIRHFFKDIDDGKYDGFPWLGIGWQKMESKAMRGFYKMKPDQAGVLVTRVVYGSAAWGVLKKGDVILSISGKEVANDGTIQFRENERLAFSYLITKRQMGEKLNLEVLRDDKKISLSTPVSKIANLITRIRYDVRPTYYLFAGLLFVPLTQGYMSLWGKSPPAKFLNYYDFGMASEERKEVVVLGQVLAHEINVGYHSVSDVVVSRVNGKEISDIRDVIEAFEKPAGGYHVVEIDDKSDVGHRVVIDTGKARGATSEIMSRYGIQYDRSGDLRVAKQ